MANNNTNKTYWPPRNHVNYPVTTGPDNRISIIQVDESSSSGAGMVNSYSRSGNMESSLITGGKRKTIGGRGREWAHHCHKLLESMRELEDSEHFRLPVDGLKFKDYYSIVEDHMDLSQVMLNLHSGKYERPEEFSDDIKLIFSNWKLYCKDPKKHYQIYQAVHKLSWWFDLEFGKIMESWTFGKNASSRLPPKKQRLELSYSQPPPIHPAPTISFIPAVKNTPNNASTGQPTQQTRAAPTCEVKETNTRAASSGDRLEMESTSIWFGPCRSRPQKPIILSEEGFVIYLTGPSCQEQKEFKFVIKTSEIVRCCGHLGKNKKHTLFVFITPPCEKRLKDLAHSHSVFGAKPDREPFSIIAMFIKSLESNKAAKLVYFFFQMSRGNIFGQLFNEVDQKGALAILANIKPQIMGRVQDRQLSSEDPLSSPKPKSSTSSSSAFVVTTHPPPDRILEPPASPEPSERGNPPRLLLHNTNRQQQQQHTGCKQQQPVVRQMVAVSAHDISSGTISLDVTRDSPLSPEQTISDDDDDLAIIEDPREEVPKPKQQENQADLTINDENEDVVVSEQHFSIKCPITQLIMTCPVRNTHCKHNYDKSGVEQLIKNRGTRAKCPVPGCSNAIPLDMLSMEFDFDLQQFIESRIKKT